MSLHLQNKTSILIIKIPHRSMKAYLPVLTYTHLHPNSSLSRSKKTKHWLTSEGYDVHFPNIAAMVRSLVLVYDL